jgi:hypothetical protein
VSCLKDEKQELEFHKNHSSNNQLFVVLRKQITNMQKTDTKIQEMMSTIKDIDMKFEENKNFKTEKIGSFVYVKPQTADYLLNNFYGIPILVFHLSNKTPNVTFHLSLSLFSSHFSL